MGSRSGPSEDEDTQEPTDDQAGTVHQHADTALQRERFDWTETDPSVAIVLTVAEALEREPERLSPLGETIDPDALDTVVAGRSTLDADEVSVSFRYESVDVIVTGSGAVAVDCGRE
jgi:hypothetical protein